MRLTEKYEDFDIDDDNFEYPIIKHRVIDHSTDYEDKLGQYEDIEEELGIDLVTLFKAINQRPWTKYENKIDQCDSCEYMFGDIFIYFYWKNGKHLVFELKGYGKTWALTKEELE